MDRCILLYFVLAVTDDQFVLHRQGPFGYKIIFRSIGIRSLKAPVINIFPKIHGFSISSRTGPVLPEDLIVPVHDLRKIVTAFSIKEIVEYMRLLKHGIHKKFPYRQKISVGDRFFGFCNSRE